MKSVAYAGVMLIVVSGQAMAVPCDASSVSLRGDWGQARFSIEIADDVTERAQGLMFRESMAATAGMLFIYEEPQTVAFWMRNTLIPLDMIFLDETGLVTVVQENAVPLDETPIPGGDDVLMVLEINGGMASTLGITPGSQMLHPQIDQNLAIWPCSAN